MTQPITNINKTSREQLALLKEASEAINQAIGGCSQLGHTLQNPKFFMTRDLLEILREWLMANTEFQKRVIQPKLEI